MKAKRRAKKQHVTCHQLQNGYRASLAVDFWFRKPDQYIATRHSLIIYIANKSNPSDSLCVPQTNKYDRQPIASRQEAADQHDRRFGCRGIAALACLACSCRGWHRSRRSARRLPDHLDGHHRHDKHGHHGGVVGNVRRRHEHGLERERTARRRITGTGTESPGPIVRELCVGRVLCDRAQRRRRRRRRRS